MLMFTKAKNKHFLSIFMVFVGKITYKISVGVQSHNHATPNSVELSRDCVKAKNIFILSQTEPWEILVRVAILTRTYTLYKYANSMDITLNQIDYIY